MNCIRCADPNLDGWEDYPLPWHLCPAHHKETLANPTTRKMAEVHEKAFGIKPFVETKP